MKLKLRGLVGEITYDANRLKSPAKSDKIFVAERN